MRFALLSLIALVAAIVTPVLRLIDGTVNRGAWAVYALSMNFATRTGLVLHVAQELPLQPFQNVVASGIAICDLSNLFGYGVKKITLRLGGGVFSKAMISSIQLKANGKVIFDSTGPAVDARMQYRGHAANVAFLTLDFTERFARTKMALLAGVLDTTLGIKNLRLEVTIAGATTPTLTGSAEVCLPQDTPEFVNLRPLIARVHRNTFGVTGAGTFLLPIPHLDPNQGGSVFKRIALLSANCTGIRIERNGIQEMTVGSAAENNARQVEYGRATQAGLFVADFMLDGLQEDRLLDTRQALGCNLAAVYGTFSGAETVTVESEVLEPMNVY